MSKEFPIANTASAKRELEITTQAIAELGRELLNIDHKAPFDIPNKISELELRANSLSRASEDNTVELAALLHFIQDNSVFANEGYQNLAEYAEKRLNCSGSSARAYTRTYKNMLELGLHPGMFYGPRGISFSKFKLINRAVSLELIGPHNIHLWLPHLQKEGPAALTSETVKIRIKDLITSEIADESPDSTQHVRIGLRGDQLPAYMDMVSAIKEAHGCESDGEAIMEALLVVSSNTLDPNMSIVQNQMGITQVLSTLKALVEKVSPETQVVLIGDPEESEELGVQVHGTIYGGRGKNRSEFAFVVASNKEDAAAELEFSASSIREFTLTASKNAIKLNISPEDLQELEQPEELIEEELVAQIVTPDEIEEEPTPEPTQDSQEITMDYTELVIGDQVSFEATGETLTGFIVELDFESSKAKVKVPGKRGRPRAVAFSDLIFAGDSDEVSATATPTQSVIEPTAEAVTNVVIAGEITEDFIDIEESEEIIPDEPESVEDDFFDEEDPEPEVTEDDFSSADEARKFLIVAGKTLQAQQKTVEANQIKAAYRQQAQELGDPIKAFLGAIPATLIIVRNAGLDVAALRASI
jgi:hypothetical protein